MTERIKSTEATPTPEPEYGEKVEFIHSGSLLLNLAASGRGLDGGWARGRVVNVVGDGSSGKTLLALEFAAYCYHRLRACRHYTLWPQPKTVKIVYNNKENVMDFPVEAMYGQDFFDAVEWIHTPTVEEFGHHFIKLCRAWKDGQCLIYIVDSWDALDSLADLAKFDSELNGAKPVDPTSQEAKGSYGLGKQSYASKRFFKKLCTEMQGKDITLMIISQVRKKIGVTFGETQYRAGGDALNFYTHQVCWLAEKQKLHKQSLGNKLVYGVKIRSRFKRNKTAKPFREADFDIIYDWGIDDVRSMTDHHFGVENAKKGVKWNGADYDYLDFIRFMEQNPAEYEAFAKLITERWHQSERNVNPKYGRSKYAPDIAAAV
jgi:recombination protein RecA